MKIREWKINEKETGVCYPFITPETFIKLRDLLIKYPIKIFIKLGEQPIRDDNIACCESFRYSIL